MGLPSIDITFKTLGMTAIQRSQKGIVAVILEDAAGAGAAALWPQAAKAAIIQTLRNIANNFFISSLLHGFSCPYSNGKGRSTTSRAQRAAPLF